jgi:hypothetical protein
LGVIWQVMGFGLVILFSEHLQSLNTSNYDAVTISLNLLITAAHAFCYLFTSRCLVTDLNNALCLHPYRLTTLSANSAVHSKITHSVAINHELLTAPHWPSATTD